MATEDQILLKLIIKGMDPAEVQAMAAQTGDELRSAMSVQLDKLASLHQQARQAQTAADAARVQEQIKEEEKVIASINQVARAHEIAANRAQNAWKRSLEDIENLTVAGFGVKGLAEGAIAAFEKYGEELVKVNKIYGSLKGSIESMREATEGEVADIDLITTKNRAFQKDLELTDEQFGTVAKSSKIFADALGVSTKDALDSLIDGLATGRTKMLQHAGVVVDTQKAYQIFAAQLGTTADKLTDEQKKQAVVIESLYQMDRKLLETGEKTKDFASDIEQLTARWENFKDRMLIGTNRLITILTDAGSKAKEASEKIVASFNDFLTFGLLHSTEKYYAAAKAQGDAAAAKAEADRKAREDRVAAGALAHNMAAVGAGGPMLGPSDADARTALDDTAKKAEQARKEFEQLQVAADRFFQKLAGDRKDFDREGRDEHPLLSSLGFSPSTTESLTPTDDTSVIEKILGIKPMSTDELTDALQKSLVDPLEKAQEEAAKRIEAETKKFDEEMQAALRDREEALKQLTKTSGFGAGFVDMLLFGIAGPAATIENINLVKEEVNEMTSTVVGAAKRESLALGESLAATLAGDKAKRQSIRQLTHDILEGLAAQSLGKAIWETAEGFADLALAFFGNPAAGASAALHFTSAGVFASLGGAAAIAARGVGTSPVSNASAGNNVNPSSGQSSFGGSGNGAGGGAQNQQPITIQQFVFPGGEAEAGRQIVKGLNALQQQQGSSIQHLVGS